MAADASPNGTIPNRYVVRSPTGARIHTGSEVIGGAVQRLFVPVTVWPSYRSKVDRLT